MGLWTSFYPSSGEIGNPQNVEVLRNRFASLNGTVYPAVALGIDETSSGADNGDASGVVANFNDLSGAPVGAINKDSDQVFNVEKNWWGDAAGPSGSGAVSSGSVSVCPWLTTSDLNNPTFAGDCLNVIQGRTFVDQADNGIMLSADGDYPAGMMDGFSVRLYDGSWGLLEEQTTRTTSQVGQYYFDNLLAESTTYYVCGVDRSGYLHSPADLDQEVVKTNGANAFPEFAYAKTVANTSGQGDESPICWQVTLDENDGAYLGVGYVEQDTTPPAEPTWKGIYLGHGTGGSPLTCGTQSNPTYVNTPQVTFKWNPNTDDTVSYWFGTKFNQEHQSFNHPNSVKTANMTPGNNPYWYTIKAVDGSGNTALSDKCWVILDTEAPDVEITNPLNGQYVDGTVEIKGTVKDDNLTHYWLNITGPGFNGGPGTVSSASIDTEANLFSWDTTGRADGEYTIKLEAKDLANNKDSGSVHHIKVIIDRTAPDAPTLDTPEDGFRVQGIAFDQTWNEVADAVQYKYQSCHSDPGDASGACDNERYAETFNGVSNTTKSVGAGQSNGQFWWRVRAKDAAGNWSDWSESRELIIDNDQPVTEWDDLESEYVATASPTFTGSSTDQYLAGISTVEYMVKDASTSAEVLGWTTATPLDSLFDAITEAFSASPTLADGNYTLSARAIDRAGNIESTDYLSVIIDTLAPESSIASPSADQVFSSELIIVGNTTDVNGVSFVDLSYTDYTVETDTCGETYTSIDTITADGSTDYDWSLPWTPPAEGRYCIKAAGTDVAGNVEHSAIVKNVIFDKTIPEITLTINPTDPDGERGWYITEPSITLTAADSFGVKAIEYQWNGQVDGSWTSVSAASITITPPSEAAHVLYYRALDDGDQYSDTGVKVVNYDKTNPSAVSDLNLGVSGNTIEVEWEAATDNTGIYRYQITWTNSELDISRSETVPASQRSFTITDLESGSWRVGVRAVDNPGLVTDTTQSASVGQGIVAGVTTAIANELEGFGVGGAFGFGANAQNTGAADADQSDTNQEDNANNDENNGQVAGVSDDTCADWQFYWPLVLLLGFAAFAIIVEMIGIRFGIARHLVTLGLAMGVIILFYLTKNSDCYQGNAIALLDQWFWLVSSLTAGLIIMASRFLIADEA